MKSHFIRFNLFLDTSKLDCKDLAHLTLLTELWLQCPIRHPDTGILESLDDVVARRSTGILSITNTIGYDGALFKPGSYSHLVHFSGEAAIGKYFEAIGILKEALFNVEFTEDRIRTTIVQLLNSIPGYFCHSKSQLVSRHIKLDLLFLFLWGLNVHFNVSDGSYSYKDWCGKRRR